jgi:prepilin-type N-terminal cleavage/methylation domain-containing protein
MPKRQGEYPFRPVSFFYGFTLLELLIVVVIIAALASLAAPGFSRSIERAKVKDAETVLSAIYTAEKIYRLDQGTYGTLANLTNTANNYMSDPNTSPDWGYTTSGVSATAFTATAQRTGGSFNGNTITVNENFNGSSYGGNHPLRDQ